MSNGIRLTLAEHGKLPDPINFACAVYRALHRLSSNEMAKSEWTHAIANVVARLCPFGLEVYGKQWKSLGYGEYLLDQCWRQTYKVDGTAGIIPGAIVFGMECEWQTGIRDQFRDFQKLLDVRSTLYLYIGALSRFSSEDAAINLLSVMTKLHSTFSGELIIYHFDRAAPCGKFKAWLIRRPVVTDKIELYSLTQYLVGEAFSSTMR